MNNLKKLGLTALAGSLVAVSAQAGELSVSGSAAIAYKNQSNKNGVGTQIVYLECIDVYAMRFAAYLGICHACLAYVGIFHAYSSNTGRACSPAHCTVSL